MTDFSLRKAVEEELLCHLCYDLLKDPRDLDCPHVFCLQCIKKLVGNSVTIECPECRHVTFVPTDGMETLKPNLRMRNMIDKLSSYIKRNNDDQNDLLTPRCPHHSNERLNFKCATCDVLICQFCIVRQHKRHEIQELSTNGAVNEIKFTFNKCQTEIQKLNSHLKHLTDLEASIIRDLKSEDSKLDQQVQLLIADLQSEARAIKVRMNWIKKQKLTRLQEERTVTKDNILKLEKVCESTMKSCQVPDKSEQNQLCDAMAKACISGSIVSDLEQPDVKFQINRHTLSTCLFHIGHLLVRRKLTLSSEFGIGSFQKAQGIAVTKNGLLAVADSRANHVGVYRYEDCRYKNAFLLGAPDGQITRPLDVAVGTDGKFLVVDSSLVKVYSNDGKFERSFGTGLQVSKSENLSAPQGITTTSNGDNYIIVVADLGRQVVTLHNSSGAFLRMLKVDVDPRNRIATNGRQIFFTNYQEGKVCAIDFQSGDKLQQLDIPKVTAICCDEKSGSIILGRNDGTQGSGVIEQYCMTTGKLVARLASDLYAALGMTLTDDDKLIVADMISVKVYAISNF